MIWQSKVMLDPAWHTEASRGMWMNYLPPALRTLFMFGLGLTLLAIGLADLWVVLRRKPALIVDTDGPDKFADPATAPFGALARHQPH